MASRIFVQFRTDRVPGENAQTPRVVAVAACLKLLDREFDHRKDFLHTQGETLRDKAHCHIVIDCNFVGSNPDLQNIDLH